MTGREWKPGDLAATEMGYVIFCHEDEHEPSVLRWIFGDGSGSPVGATHLSRVRPLVVIDPEDREQVERLTGALAINGANPSDDNYWIETQAALRSLVAPPKPEEPKGMGAVVEDADGVRYVGLGDYYGGGALRWKGGRGMTFTSYDHINAVRILSDGVMA